MYLNKRVLFFKNDLPQNRAVLWNGFRRDRVSGENKVTNKSIKYGFSIIYGVLFIGVIQFFFDENHSNDHYGWIFRSLHLMINDLRNGNKKGAIYNLIFAIFVLGILLWIITKYNLFWIDVIFH